MHKPTDTVFLEPNEVALVITPINGGQGAEFRLERGPCVEGKEFEAHTVRHLAMGMVAMAQQDPKALYSLAEPLARSIAVAITQVGTTTAELVEHTAHTVLNSGGVDRGPRLVVDNTTKGDD